MPATILPFYEWQADIAPVTRKRGIVRRTAPFDLQVTNLGNDWLYCDLALPARKDIRITTDTARLAVPPAEAGQTVNFLGHRRDGGARRIPAQRAAVRPSARHARPCRGAHRDTVEPDAAARGRSHSSTPLRRPDVPEG